MNVFNKVTCRTLKRNKTRTVVTIFGIILSAAMFTAVTTFISSLQAFAFKSAVLSDGDWHYYEYNIDTDELGKVKNDSRVDKTATLQMIGYTQINSIDESKPYVFVGGTDSSFIDMMPVIITDGRLPENSSEIILPQHLSSNGGVNYKLNDVLTLELGDRRFEGKAVYQSTAFSAGETLEVHETRRYKVVGFYERPTFEAYSAPGYTAITVMDKNPADYVFEAYIKLHKAGNISDFALEKSEQGIIGDFNKDVLMFSGAYPSNTFVKVLYSIGSFLAVLIMFGAISLIYNAFSISVSERISQFGLLSSVGATRKQIMKSVRFEAFVVSVIGIPLGILCGIAGIGITLWLIRDNMSIFLGGNLKFGLTVSPLAIVLSVIISAVTVMISSFIPARKAARISTIDAIKNSSEIRIKGNKMKTSKLTYAVFGLEGMLAQKNFKRNRKKYRSTIISLFMSIVLFISASSFCSYLTTSVSGVFDSNEADLIYYNEKSEDVSKLYRIFSDIEGIEKMSHAGVTYATAETSDNSIFTDEYREAYGEELYLNACIMVVDNQTYKEYLKENKLSESVYMNPDKPIGIATGRISQYNADKDRYINFDVFSAKNFQLNIQLMHYLEPEVEEQMTDEERNVYYEKNYDMLPVSVGLITEKLAFGANGNNGNGLTIMYPEGTVPQVIKENAIKRDTYRDSFYFKAKNHKEVSEKMSKALVSAGLTDDTINNCALGEENERSSVLIIQVFSYGFIALISLIAVANVFNTISTNIRLRRREFAMLRSVGMTKRGFNRMMNYECLLYGVKSLLYGLPMSFLMTYWVFHSLNLGWEMQFYIPWVSVILAVCSVFFVVFITMLYAMRKIKKDNPIDALKNENI